MNVNEFAKFPIPERVNRKAKAGFRVLAPVMLVALLCGCANSNVTNPPRSATEQLLLSTAADRAINSAGLSVFENKKVFVDGTYFDSYDSKYVLGAIRDALSQSGALLINDVTNSDYVVEARSGGLAIDSSDSLVGIPQSGLPIPLTGVVQIPELALYKASRQNTIAKLSLLAYDTKSREHYYSSGPLVGLSYNKYYKLLFLIQWTSTDIPEKKIKKKK